MERKLQTEIIKFFREHGAYVIKTRPGPGTPVGCPDVVALYRWKHAEVEVKAAPKSPYQTGQEETLKRLRRGNEFVYRADPETWPGIKAELLEKFF
jgi:Holliday junction resolvase